MCTSPIYIRNVNSTNNLSKFRIRLRGSEFVDTCFYTCVPCGHCDDCLVVKQSSWIQRIEEMYKTHYIIYGTATYQASMVPEFKTSLGEIIRYPDYSDFRNMIKRIRKYVDFPPFKYLCVSEYGGLHHRPHFHYFIFIKRNKEDSPYYLNNLVQSWEDIFKRQWKRRVSKSVKNPVYKPLSKFLRFRNGTGTYDIHAVLPRKKKDGKVDTIGDVSHYVTKYILKPDNYVDNLLKSLYVHYCTGETTDEYHQLRKLVRPRIYASLGIGLTEESANNIREYIVKSKTNNPEKGPRYFSQDNGKGTYLSRYYRHKYLELCDVEFFARHSGNQLEYDGRLIWLPDSSYTPEDIDNIVKREMLWRKRRELIRSGETLELLKV